jgi:hypothetical protein
MSPSEKEFSDALILIGEEMHQLEVRLARLEAGLFVVKGVLATLMDRENPVAALARIEEFLKEAEQKWPGADRRELIAQQIDMLKLIVKHGGPKNA